ncbi:MAG: tRNA (adenosine(37)-N6)-threonylcarbamoyltransferase complex ATPase subunit type 1 TsaE [Chlorobi bacterium]|nr:tRNA (adenosine(37)-N6)-threonylcarbamoyltransferase complex ATPase subunit type 1 TsaE [Chlorobiota bacterium]
MEVFEINREEELDQLAKYILLNYPDRQVFALYGPLGAGKTTFIKYLSKQLGVVDSVKSPTYTLANVYKTYQNEKIYHLDLFRIKESVEWLDIGVDDYIEDPNAVIFVEWPEKIRDLLPPDRTLMIHINPDPDTQKRKIVILLPDEQENHT